MGEKAKKTIVVPVDGSTSSMKAPVFLKSLYGIEHDVRIVLLHILPSLPPALLDDSRNDPETANKLKGIQEKSVWVGKKLLRDAKSFLIQEGFTETAIETVLQKRHVGIARDICAWCTDRQPDAIVISASGRSKIESLLMGKISHKIAELCRSCPVWLIKGEPRNRNILLAIDNSQNALRAAEHLGFMLSGTARCITLFHSIPRLSHFATHQMIDAFPELIERWKRITSDHLAPYVRNAKNILIAAGIPERQLTAAVVEASRSTANDIFKQSADAGAGAIVLGCKGHTNAKEFLLGSVAKKVMGRAEDMVICLVP